ncbi:MAG: M23 family metallopeptidase [Desulfobacteraceae bacterium]|jgi:murein DD-endopeptidase MepM/ murein hydrolase activator NlpD
MNFMNSSFTEMIIEANGLDPNDFVSWVFYPEMLFNSPDKWWGDRGRRDFPHEGIDFCLYMNRSRAILPIGAQTRIPVIHDGIVRAMFRDYLGVAFIVEHEGHQSGDRKYLSVYAHTSPLDDIRPGDVLEKGDIIATITDTSRSKAKIRPHLHFTMAYPSPDLTYESFVWNNMRDPDLATLIDPLSRIELPYQVVDVKSVVSLK